MANETGPDWLAELELEVPRQTVCLWAQMMQSISYILAERRGLQKGSSEIPEDMPLVYNSRYDIPLASTGQGMSCSQLGWLLRNIVIRAFTDLAPSDIGWIVGHSYIIYGPLLVGAATVLYEGKQHHNIPSAHTDR